MSTAELKNAIHQKVDATEQEWLLSNVLQLLNEQHDDAMSEKNYAELMSRREKYLSGESKTYSWEEVQTHMKEKFGL